MPVVSLTLVGIGVGIVLFGVSGYQVWTGVRNFQYGSAIANATPLTDTTPPGHLAIAEGIVRGSAEGRMLESRLGGASCVAYSSKKVKQKSYSGQPIHRSLGGNYREKISEKSDVVPFILETDTGPVHVESSTARVVVADDEYEPVSARQVLENKGLLYGIWRIVNDIVTTTDKDVRRRYLEAAIGPGDRIGVVGAISNSGTGEEVALENGGGSPLLVTSRSQSRLVDIFKSKAKGRLFGGVVILGIGIVSLLAGTGFL